jgi:ABC-type glutathione transport system ATPase component
MTPDAPVLDIKDFSVVYRTPGGDVRAVNRVNLALRAGEVVGLAGESGSGKSTLAYAVCRLLRAPALITGGSVTYQGRRAAGPTDVGGGGGARRPPRRGGPPTPGAAW